MALIRSAFTVGAMTMASRVLGFARDWLMALTLGAGTAADAFFVAFKLPTFFRRLFAEGAFSAAFVPYFSAIYGQDPQAGQAFAQRVLSIFLPVLIVFIAVVELTMPAVVYALTGGFADNNADKLALAIQPSRLTVPFLALISLVTLCAGVLNGLGKFAAAAAVPCHFSCRQAHLDVVLLVQQLARVYAMAMSPVIVPVVVVATTVVHESPSLLEVLDP